ncbi:MAG: hypothetical protein A2Y00_01590 [Omnitrophica WOR_2 bacterium GWF2_43_52]|nr:MAG: hypothetical protein A2062_06395 [Omnitrophica WOR_2 bacterium GWA2_44_7]OGX20049.1 MAG: hypothetical protein A2Y00_01590 [Omnitrophica WOR_2 bacterium GWF2_43_52]OGX55239.1 MAG: hypothetical protein A2460_05010 [Omnitrophica WOR_2 bacterium RIFOXYC2_FULL_43_9]HAH19657.1 hypothetical protein [Candidatus Omnitrophota bacterium]HBG64090.1 hypothetical protein [Candidatus Omnitrophota bacterium]
MRKSKIFIKKAMYNELLAYCLKEPQKETCGILAGKAARIEKIFPLTNISDSPKLCYHIDPKEQLAVFKELRKQAIEMVAIYHSHVDSQAYPSQRDIELAFYPESSYIIVSLSDPGQPQVRSFKIVEGKIIEEELVIENA